MGLKVTGATGEAKLKVNAFCNALQTSMTGVVHVVITSVFSGFFFQILRSLKVIEIDNKGAVKIAS